MSHQEILADLAQNNLRLATKDEAGWYVRYPTEQGTKSFWVTNSSNLPRSY